jgi:hypothetical protein
LTNCTKCAIINTERKREVIKMIKANEALAKVNEIERKEKEAIKARAIQFCETVVNTAIEEKIALKGTLTMVHCEPELKEDAYNYLCEQGYTVYYTGIHNLDIRWNKVN